MSQLVYCRNCGIKFLTEFKSTDFYGEVCSPTCSDELSDKLEIEKSPVKSQLSIAELDIQTELDQPLEQVSKITDILIDRWRIPDSLEFYFRGPQPNGWPEEVRLRFPIATYRTMHKEQRVFGLDEVLLLIKSLIKPCFRTTQVIPRSKVPYLQAIKPS